MASAAQEIDWDRIDKTKFFVYGMGAFSGVTTLLYPLTVVKVNIQASRGESSQGFKGAWLTGKSVVATDGIAGLYKGYTTILFGMIPARMVYLTALELSKSTVNQVGRKLEVPETALAGVSNSAAGACASLATQIIVVPIDVVSQRQMVGGAGAVATTTTATSTASLAHALPPTHASVPSHSAVQAAAHAAGRPSHSAHGPSMPASPSPAASSASSQSSSRMDKMGKHRLHTLAYSQPSHKLASLLQQQQQSLTAGRTASVQCRGQSTTGTAVHEGAAVHESSGLRIARLIIKEEGIRGLYRGFGASVATFVPSSALWWGTYGVYQNLLWGAIERSSSPAVDMSPSSSSPASTSQVVGVQVASAVMAGASASFMTSPLDLVKTRIQVARQVDGQASTVRTVFQEILREDGWRGMFRGAVPRMANAALWGTCMVSTYEYLKRVAKKET